MNRHVAVCFLCLVVMAAPAVYAQERASEEKLRTLLGQAYMEKKDFVNAAAEYDKVTQQKPGDRDAGLAKAEALIAGAQYADAEQCLDDLVGRYPRDSRVMTLRADVYAYQQQYGPAIALYRDALAITPDRGIAEKLADTLSWDAQYEDALAAYARLIAEQDTAALHVKRARVLGWTRRYRESFDEYDNANARQYSDAIAQEKRAKEAYYEGRFLRAADAYELLRVSDPLNQETLFDLGQIYAWYGQWGASEQVFDDLLRVDQNHSRAHRALDAVDLRSRRIRSSTVYELYEADSQSRGVDIKKQVLATSFDVPVGEHIIGTVGYGVGWRDFADHGHMTERASRAAIVYRSMPWWWVDGHYGQFDYSGEPDAMHEFGSAVNARMGDYGVLRLSHERRRLEDTYALIEDGAYHDDYRVRADGDVTRRLKVGADYRYGHYSDSNRVHEPGADVKYFVSLEPTALYLQYRYFFRDFDRTVDDYFSPRDYANHTVSAVWRHYLNREEIFFGGNDIYYELRYDVSCASDDIVGHTWRSGFVWDITKRVQVRVEGQCVRTSASVYRDRRAVSSVHVYF